MIHVCFITSIQARRLASAGHLSDLGSWLFENKTGVAGVWGFGCKACHLQNLRTPFGLADLRSERQLKTPRFRKHTQQVSHLRAVANLTNCRKCKELADAADDKLSAPLLAEFKSTWDNVLHARELHTRSEKPYQIKFCIAEALRMHDRAAIECADVVVIHADSRKHRMTVRYSACSRGLILKKGYFGHVNCVSQHTDSVEHYLQTVLSVLKNFCTEALGVPPGSHTDGLVQFNEKLYSHLMRVCLVWNADAEPCIQLAGWPRVLFYAFTHPPFLPRGNIYREREGSI